MAVTKYMKSDLSVQNAKKYLELELRIDQIKKKLKELEDEKKQIVEFFKAKRTGEVNEVLKIRSAEGNFNICFTDTTRKILDQTKAKELLIANNLEVPYKSSNVMQTKILAAVK